MKSYLSLIPISAKVHKRQNRMTLLCIIFAVFLVTAVFSMADMGIRMEQQRLLEKHDGLNMQDITDSAMGQSLYLSASVLFVLILIAGVLMISSSINSNVAQRTKILWHDALYRHEQTADRALCQTRGAQLVQNGGSHRSRSRHCNHVGSLCCFAVSRRRRIFSYPTLRDQRHRHHQRYRYRHRHCTDCRQVSGKACRQGISCLRGFGKRRDHKRSTPWSQEKYVQNRHGTRRPTRPIYEEKPDPDDRLLCPQHHTVSQFFSFDRFCQLPDATIL